MHSPLAGCCMASNSRAGGPQGKGTVLATKAAERQRQCLTSPVAVEHSEAVLVRRLCAGSRTTVKGSGMTVTGDRRTAEGSGRTAKAGEKPAKGSSERTAKAGERTQRKEQRKAAK